MARGLSFLFIYLPHGYVARTLTMAERAACFLHHNRRLYAELPDELLRILLADELELSSHHTAATRAHPEPCKEICGE